MKLYLQYTSDIDKAHIKEAAILSEKYTEQEGWKFIGAGCYKRAYRKGNIVVKFNSMADNNMHMLKEILLYREAPRKYKKHMARIFGGDGTRIIQKAIDDSGSCFNEKELVKMKKVAKNLGMGDFAPGHNVVITRKREMIFYDFSGHCLRNI
jgi:Zn/Cd-binding protein ZinT